MLSLILNWSLNAHLKLQLCSGIWLIYPWKKSTGKMSACITGIHNSLQILLLTYKSIFKMFIQCNIQILDSNICWTV